MCIKCKCGLHTFCVNASTPKELVENRSLLISFRMLSFHSKIIKKNRKKFILHSKKCYKYRTLNWKKKFILCANKNTICHSTRGTKNLQVRFHTEVYQPTCMHQCTQISLKFLLHPVVCVRSRQVLLYSVDWLAISYP